MGGVRDYRPSRGSLRVTQTGDDALMRRLVFVRRETVAASHCPIHVDWLTRLCHLSFFAVLMLPGSLHALAIPAAHRHSGGHCSCTGMRHDIIGWSLKESLLGRAVKQLAPTWTLLAS